MTHPCGPQDNLGLLAQMVEAFGEEPGVRERAGGSRLELESELATCRATHWPERRVLYLIWRDPWMTVARDTYISRMLAQVGWQTWPVVDGGPQGAARYPVVASDAPWLAEVERVLLSSEPYRFDASHVDEVRRLAPRARVDLVDGELLSWYGPRTAAGLAYLRRLAGRA